LSGFLEVPEGDAMSDKHYWFGYFEAGEKSSPVLRDNRIDTGNPDTLYLFNLKRNEILEYRRDIIEPKLRELKTGEEALCGELKTAYIETRGQFTPRIDNVTALPAKGRAKPQTTAANDDSKEQKELEEFDDNGDDDWLEEEA